MRFYPELNGYVSAPVLCAVPLAYISVLYMLRFYMEDKKAMQLSVLIRLFNACQVGLAVLMTYKLAANFIVWNPFMSNTEFTAYTEYWLFVHYLGKYLDLFESVIIVLRKRTSQLTTLHLVHHSSILVIWGWLLNVGLANGTASYGALVNSFVHAVMY
ncbi:Elongation of fatty acids protein, partial [Diplonema papillatum]